MNQRIVSDIKYRRITLLIIVVILFYIFFTVPSTLSAPPFNFHTESYYSLLSKGFLSGQLSLTLLPSEKLLALPNPYDPVENSGLRLHDASLYHGKYYLYYGPLPALAFFIPLRLLTGVYPTETLSVLFFLSNGFIFIFALIIKIKKKYFPEISEAHVLFAGFLLAFSTTAPFLLTRGLFYESAIASAFWALSIAFYFLYNAITNNFIKIKDVALFSFFLGLAVAGRPNFSLLCFIFIPSVLIYLIKYAPRHKLKALITSLLLPICIIAFGLAMYNYLRFDSFFQFGGKYQLTGANITQLPQSFFNFNFQHIVNILYLNFLQPFTWTSKYRHLPSLPHIYLGQTILPSNQIYFYDPVSGVLMISPIIIFIIGLFVGIKYSSEKNKLLFKNFFTFVFFMCLTPAVTILFFLFFNSYTSQRYEMDFSPYLIFLSIIGYWLLQQCSLKPWILNTMKALYILLGVISILIGFDIGITGYGI